VPSGTYVELAATLLEFSAAYRSSDISLGTILSSSEPASMSEAVTKAGMGDGMTKAKRSSLGNPVTAANSVRETVAGPASPAAVFEPAEPEAGPVPIVGPVSVIGGVGVARQHTAIVRIVVEACIAGIRGRMRLRW
jgi:hypothetical protein